MPWGAGRSVGGRSVGEGRGVDARGERGRRRRVGHAALPDRCACSVHRENVFAVDTRRTSTVVSIVSSAVPIVSVSVFYIRASVRRSIVVGF